MKSMPRWQRAWRKFSDMLCGTKKGRPSYCRKTRRPDAMKLYWKLIGVSRELGILTYVKPDLGEAVDFYGNHFTVGGCWNGRNVQLIYRSFPTLAHEIAHAVDQMLGGRQHRPDVELVAAAAGYMLTHEYLGARSPAFDVQYAKRQGAKPEDLKRLEAHIFSVFETMQFLMDQA